MNKVKLKGFKYISFMLILLMIIWGGMNIIHPTIVAAIQGDEWGKIFKAIVHMRINETDVVKINDKPVSFLEKEEGMLELYLKEEGNLVDYFGEFMECWYINQEGNKIELKGRKCTEDYTMWYQTNTKKEK